MTWVSIEGVAEARTRGEDYRNVADRGPYHGHVAGMIDDAVFLLEARIVFLVDHDQSEILIGEEQSRARADNRPGPSGGHIRPCSCPLALADRGMPFNRQAAEALLEAGKKLPRQGNLRQHDQNLLSLFQRARHGLEIDLRFARSGNAVEQGRGINARVDERPHQRDGLKLTIAEFLRGKMGIWDGGPFGRELGLDQSARFDETAYDGGADAGFLGKSGFGPEFAILEQFKHPGAGRRHSLGRRAAPANADLGFLMFEHAFGAHEHFQSHAAIGECI